MDNKLLDVITRAKQNVPFYSELYKEISLENGHAKFEDIPLITKSQLLESDYSNISKVISSIDPKRLIYIPTSGSTGKCMNTIWLNSDYVTSLVPLWTLRKRRYGIKPQDKFCCFFTNQYVEKNIAETESIIFSGNKMLVSKNNLNPHKLQKICKLIFDFAPKWMVLQPSIALLLCQTIKDNNIKVNSNLSYIEFTGEILSPSTRKVVQEVFCCKIANQYGCNEVNSMAYECEQGNLHVMGDCNYIEIRNKGRVAHFGVEGDIYVTSLYNSVMPFIRYETSDRGVLYPASFCKCGNKHNVLKLLTGRTVDYILTSDGNKVSISVFIHVIEIINDAMDDVIRQFQIIQKNYHQFLIKMVIENYAINDDFVKESICYLFVQTLKQESLIGSQFSFEFYDAFFPDSITGKHKLFIQKLC